MVSNSDIFRCVSRPWKAEGTNFTYNRPTCMKLCAQSLISDNCNCTSIHHIHNVHIGGSNLNRSGYCLHVDAMDLKATFEKVLCEQRQRSKILNDMKRNCVCDWLCEEKSYDVFISSAQWPRDAILDSFILKYIIQADNRERDMFFWKLIRKYPQVLSLVADLFVQLFPEVNVFLQRNNFTQNSSYQTNATSHFLDLSESASFQQIFLEAFSKFHTMENNYVLERNHWISKSFFHVNIYFRDLTVYQQEQVPAVSFPDLCSAIGGLLGLWAGVSVITIIEIFSLAANLMKALLFHRKGKKTLVVPLTKQTDKNVR